MAEAKGIFDRNAATNPQSGRAVAAPCLGKCERAPKQDHKKSLGSSERPYSIILRLSLISRTRRFDIPTIPGTLHAPFPRMQLIPWAIDIEPETVARLRTELCWRFVEGPADGSGCIFTLQSPDRQGCPSLYIFYSADAGQDLSPDPTSRHPSARRPGGPATGDLDPRLECPCPHN